MKQGCQNEKLFYSKPHKTTLPRRCRTFYVYKIDSILHGLDDGYETVETLSLVPSMSYNLVFIFSLISDPYGPDPVVRDFQR